MHAFDVLGDPVRRRILELLADSELTSGAVCAVIQREFGISQPGVSAHLRVLREAGFASSRADGARRLYSIDPAGLRDADIWLERFRHFWTPRLDALETELARGRRQRAIAEQAERETQHLRQPALQQGGEREVGQRHEGETRHRHEREAQERREGEVQYEYQEKGSTPKP